MPVDRALSTLLIAVPDAEPVVGAHRLRLDPSARAGVPAHVTVLFPFAPADELDGGKLGRLAAVIGAVHAFGYRFSRTAWFDDRVLYLAPDDDAPFRELTHRVHAEFRRTRRSRARSTTSSRTSPSGRTSRPTS